MATFLVTLHRIERWLAGTLLALMAVLLMGDVLGRELGFGGSAWAQRAGLMCMIWAAFLGVPLTSAQGRHLRAEFTDRWWSPTVKPAMRVIEELCVAVFCLGCAYFAVQYCWESAALADRDPVLEVPLWITQLVIPYALGSTGLRHLIYAFVPALRPARGGPS